MECQPDQFITGHTLEYRFIQKAYWKEQIDGAVAENFDFYFNMMGVTSDGPVAAQEESCYFESLAEGCNEFEESYNLTSRHANGFPVQECIDDVEYTCSVIQMGSGCLALLPVIHEAKDGEATKTSSMSNMKHPNLARIEAVGLDKSPGFVERLQEVAMEAFVATGYAGSNIGCNVNIRVRLGGTFHVTGIHSSRPAVLLPRSTISPMDCPSLSGLPGGQAALIDIFIANYILANPNQQSQVQRVADSYDDFAPAYDAGVAAHTTIPATIKGIIQQNDFSGIVFDLACGTGIFGRLVAERQPRQNGAGAQTESRLYGFDISRQMLNICREHGIYNGLHIQSLEGPLLNSRRYMGDEAIDHIVCFSALHFLRPELFTFFMALALTVARRSVTVSIDEVPESYNEQLSRLDQPYLHSYNHVDKVKLFAGVPGWTMVRGERVLSWRTVRTVEEIYTTFFRFERVGNGMGGLFKGAGDPN
ncbi:hypothetical protein BDW74DRAFT_169773 [Aspergillus multicolor]|uniref:class I SAM-dependent DNA methyltransferase n=1 Tax=Aspergillus multicolor TaxID=41759 RepID=UPI003CCCF88D